MSQYCIEQFAVAHLHPLIVSDVPFSTIVECVPIQSVLLMRTCDCHHLSADSGVWEGEKRCY